MIKELDEYTYKKVKRKNTAICKHCNKNINKGDYADIIYCLDFFTGYPNTIAITCCQCTNDFINNDINKNNNK